MKKIIFIVGPTAVGKSSVAYKLAQMIDGEIVSCDAMQVYKEVSIVSNKPSREELRKVQHHLISIISLSEEFDVVAFNQKAINAIEDILKRKKIPIVVGGSGLYMQALLDGIFEGAKKDDVLREKLTVQAQKYGNEYLYKKLKIKDPEAASKIHSNDLKRVVRALEVCMTQGQKFSDLKQNRQGIWGQYDIRIIGLNRNREELYQMVNNRVDQMMRDGLVEEIESLKSVNMTQAAVRMIGIREIRSVIEGKLSLAEALEKMKMNTRRYAKRQLTWFRKEKRIDWIEINSDDTVEAVVKKVLLAFAQLKK